MRVEPKTNLEDKLAVTFQSEGQRMQRKFAYTSKPKVGGHETVKLFIGL